MDYRYELLLQGGASDSNLMVAERTILDGACQIIASRLLHQKIQESKGHHELHEAVSELNRLKELNRKRAKQGPKRGGGHDIRL